jgi:hypothetical protein
MPFCFPEDTMSMRRISLAALAVSVLTLIAACGSARAEDVIARFMGTAPGVANTHPVTMVGVTLMSTGKNITIPIPNEPNNKKGSALAPQKNLDEAIKKLTVGQIVKVSVDATKDYGQALTAIAPYNPKPGEDTPNGYVFSKTVDKIVGKNTLTTVVLTKFGVEHSFTIAMRRDDKGESEQDPDVVEVFSKLTADSPVWVQTVGKSVVAIEPYTEPKTGKLGKSSDVDVDGHKVRSAEIATDDGRTVTVMVPGKESGKTFVSDTLVMGQLAKVKPGSQVTFRVREDGDKMWLREILAVKPEPKKPTETTMKKPE